jgi:prolyl-tRNA editing enzyme YbaK/EbsC (Cys-tRNA(Pro) deacylase)
MAKGISAAASDNAALGYAKKFAQRITELGVDAEHLMFDQSCHSVAQAAAAINGTDDDLVKNICLTGPNEEFIIAIVKGPHRVSRKRVAKACELACVEMATAEKVLGITGYPIGGTPSFGVDARYLIDPAVMEQAIVYTGGGSDRALVKISTETLQQTNQAQVVRIRK